MAHAMALESPHIVADVVEIQEYPHLAQLYAVRAVPKTVINKKNEFTGAVSEEVLLRHILQAAGVEEPGEEGHNEEEAPAQTLTPL